MTARIKLDVHLAGGRVRLDLKQPTEEQLTTIVGLLEKWMNEDGTEPPKAPVTPETDGRPLDAVAEIRPKPIPEPIERGGGAYRLCGVMDAPTGHRCRRGAGHEDKHAWWGRGSTTHHWTDDPEEKPEPVETAVSLETVPATEIHSMQDVKPVLQRVAERQQSRGLASPPVAYAHRTEPAWPCPDPACAKLVPFTSDKALEVHGRLKHGPATTLCRCGHAERMHEKDAGVDSGRGECHHRGCGCAEHRVAS